jgi:monofunctional glycosyltransferase
VRPIFSFLFALCGGLLLAVLWLDGPSRGPVRPPEALRAKNPQTTTLIELRKAEARAKRSRFAPVQRWVPLTRISPALKNAVLAAEDIGFYRHHGVEWVLVREAVKDNWRAGKPVRGASTITQQLAKNLYLTPRKTYLRKARELFYAWRLELALPKDRILELYLNVVEWGEGIFGAEAAAWVHFGKPASAINEEEAVALAAMLPSPRRHSPGDGTPWTARRQDLVRRHIARVAESRAGKS